MNKPRIRELFDKQIIRANKADRGVPYLYFFVKDSETHVRLTYLSKQDTTYEMLYDIIEQKYDEVGEFYLGDIKQYNDEVLQGKHGTFPVLLEKETIRGVDT